ncbi:alpha-N-acetylgalactosamine-specific lectin-like [Asterias amurensis]|uniref:alpha-N-acetylgalactosamine-specific lectin-like n=1 Tax=Asterias amurensis TaxID=7602 RepID=UPI003AB60D52
MASLIANCLLILAAVTFVSAQDCPPYWSISGDYCLQFFKDPLTWQEAQGTCARFASCSTGASASLLKITEQSMNDRLNIFLGLKSDPTSNVWIGLNDVQTEGQYMWADGTPSTQYPYKNFAAGEPNGNSMNGQPADCFQRNGLTGTWSDEACAEAAPFVCQMVRRTPAVPATPPAAPPPPRI